MFDKILRSSDLSAYETVGELVHFEMLRSRRYQRPLSVFSIIVPDLDETSANVTVTELRKHTRRIDLVETSSLKDGVIHLICPETNAGDAAGLLRRLQALRLTDGVRIGFAAFPDDGSSIDLLVEASRERAQATDGFSKGHEDSVGVGAGESALDASNY